METFLNVYAPIAIALFAVGIALRLGRWAKAAATRRNVHRRNPGFPVNYRRLSLL